MESITTGQLACTIFFTAVSGLYAFSEFLDHTKKNVKSKSSDAALADPESQPESNEPQKVWITCISHTTLIRAMQLNADALSECKALLRNATEFGFILLWFWLADRSGLIPEGEKSYSRDFFIFFMVSLTLVFLWKGVPVHKTKAPLNRDQTEEWKGWMQVMFLLYHYFEAREMYNAIRLFIACYVWMTGFGNFSYYYVRKDFTPGRFAHMMWRLNFFVFFCCAVMNNDYMLYYICPMHTIFTLFIYGVLGVGNQYNTSNVGIAVKVAACFCIVFFLWETPGVFKTLFRPLTWLVGYVDPRKPDVDALHEWEFRSGLDRYIWIWGMLCAYFHPRFERALTWLDDINQQTAAVIRGAVIAVCLTAGSFYYTHIYCLPKLEYNAAHPFTSWIPITLFIVLRNVTPTLRMVHIGKYAFLGKITLETYIAQFHVWLSTSNTPNAQPAKLMVLLDGYPLMNFMLCTALYVWVSFRLFNITNDMKNYMMPLNDTAGLGYNCGLLAAMGAATYLAALVLGVMV
mmetsp:Transcript_28546/g.62505  ORF Transcript_28546/g.62505 Transcript_28546/m.62505 type:complete len:516 (-) Transcript_28546:575-2122(-)